MSNHGQISLIVEDDQLVCDSAATIVGTVFGSPHLVERAYTLSDAEWYLRSIRTIRLVFLDGIMPNTIGTEKTLENTLDFLERMIDLHPGIIWVAFSALNNEFLFDVAKAKNATIYACNQKDIRPVTMNLFKTYRDLFLNPSANPA